MSVHKQFDRSTQRQFTESLHHQRNGQFIPETFQFITLWACRPFAFFPKFDTGTGNFLDEWTAERYRVYTDFWDDNDGNYQHTTRTCDPDNNAVVESYDNSGTVNLGSFVSETITATRKEQTWTNGTQVQELTQPISFSNVVNNAILDLRNLEFNQLHTGYSQPSGYGSETQFYPTWEVPPGSSGGVLDGVVYSNHIVIFPKGAGYYWALGSFGTSPWDETYEFIFTAPPLSAGLPVIVRSSGFPIAGPFDLVPAIDWTPGNDITTFIIKENQTAAWVVVAKTLIRFPDGLLCGNTYYDFETKQPFDDTTGLLEDPLCGKGSKPPGEYLFHPEQTDFDALAFSYIFPYAFNVNYRPDCCP